MDTPHPPEGESPVIRAQAVGSMPPPPPPAPPQIIVQQPGKAFGRWAKLLMVALSISIMVNISQRASYDSYFTSGEKIEEKYVSHSRTAKDKIAVIRLEGTIMSGEGFVKRQIDQVRKDKSIKAVVLRINSPGGTVTGSDYLYHHVQEVVTERDIPLVVSMGGLCASGGYYVAMAVGDAENSIYAEPTTWTGSIGVIIPHYDMSGLLERWNIEDDSVVSHKYKQLLSMTRKRTDEENVEVRLILQDMVDQSFAGFKDIVRAGRPKFREDESALDAVATGQVFTATQAMKNGLVDRIGFLEDAVDHAIELAGLDSDKVRVIKYTRKIPGMLEILAGGQSRAAAAWPLDLGRMLDMTAPRAYYLCTWMPALLSNTRP